MKHIIVWKCKPVLLLLDINQSRLSLRILYPSKVNKVELLSFLPHIANKLKLLCRSTYGPFKKFLDGASGARLGSHPEKL